MIEALLNVPKSADQWNLWSFANRDHHDLIRQAIVAKKGPSLVDWQLDPIYGVDLRNWLQRHQQSHLDFDGVLSLQSNNLLDVNLQDNSQLVAWIYLHQQEHFDAAQALGI